MRTKASALDPAQFLAAAKSAFFGMISQPDYPCLGAKAAVNAASLELRTYPELVSPETTKRLARDLTDFIGRLHPGNSAYASFVAVFQHPQNLDEARFETRLWQQLDELNRIDSEEFEWDPNVSADPSHPRFSFSFAGQALYVIGLHAQSSRMARRFPWPALVFNPHEQFERLRAEGKWKRMQQSIRDRDVEVQGNINPMLSDFGERSEARQYAGREVDESWQPPFKPRQTSAAKTENVSRCPFHNPSA